ncbi:MAG: N-acetylmuramoyl-L-alanine amidase [Clostridia bacterium]|nr:N-acetylmuramoyl-L-alanine amidase [Clostridia bacterium]
MIFIPRRKIVVFSFFIAMLAFITLTLHHNSTDVYSGKVTKCIIIDAGHGNPDGGAIGMTGTIESVINLKIAKKAEKILKKKGYTVIMTREDENSIYEDGKNISSKKKDDMYRRLEIMNSSGADMFVSIHMNKFTSSKYCGAQVIYSGNFKESEVLAQLIQKRLHSLHENKSKREHLKAPGGIFLLKKSPVPAVIVECGFLSNFEEEKLLNTDKYQQNLAKAIVKGIEDYYESRGNDKDENIRN